MKFSKTTAAMITVLALSGVAVVLEVRVRLERGAPAAHADPAPAPPAGGVLPEAAPGAPARPSPRAVIVG